MLKISDNIARRRKEKNITQEELADFMMVTKASVSKWETGQSYPDILLLPKLASFFNITIDELIGYEPQLSTEQIKKIYESLLNEIAKGDIEHAIKEAKSIANQYYSCFELLYYVGVFIINHDNLITDEKKAQEYIEYADGLFIRVYEEADNPILVNKSLNMRGICLIQLGRAKEAIEILPSSDALLSSTDCLVASAYLQTKNDEEVDKQLQIFIYKDLVDLVTLLLMKVNLVIDDWRETSKRIESLIQAFNLEEINVSLVLNFYLTMAMKYSLEKEISLANEYVEKYLITILKNERHTFEIKGDAYFNKIDNWINENLILGAKPARDKKTIYNSYLKSVTENKVLKEAISFSNTKKLIEQLVKKI